jgi:O-antigen/teichoic acid export membrane protein
MIRQAVTVLGQLSVIPVLLKFWGAQLYGEWQVLSAAASYFAVLNFGMQTYAVNRMNQHYSRGEMREFAVTLDSALMFSLAVGGAATLIAMPAVLLLPLDSWLRLDTTGGTTAKAVLSILTVHMAIALPVGVIGGVYRAIGEYSREMNIATAHAVCFFGATIAIAVLGGGPVALAVAQAAGLASVVLIVWVDLRRRHPEIRLGLGASDRRIAASLFVPSSLFFLVQMSALLAVQGSTVLVGSALGAASVAVFVAIRTFANVIPQAIGAITGALWPELTSLDARGDRSAVRSAHRLMAKLALSFAGCAAVWMQAAAPDIIHMWTRGRIQYNAALAGLLLLLQLVAAFSVAGSVVLSSSNNHRTVAASNLCGAVLGLAIGASLVRHMGAAGMALGLLFAEVATAAWIIPRAACRLLGQSWPRFVSELALRAGAVTTALFLMVQFVSAALTDSGPGERLLLLALVSAPLAVALIWLVALDSVEKQSLRSFLPSLNRLPAREGTA